jgi:hypothetical protein
MYCRARVILWWVGEKKRGRMTWLVFSHCCVLLLDGYQYLRWRRSFFSGYGLSVKRITYADSDHSLRCSGALLYTDGWTRLPFYAAGAGRRKHFTEKYGTRTAFVAPFYGVPGTA